MLLALADVLYLGFVQGIDFAGGTALLRKHTLKEEDERVVVMVSVHVTPELSDKPSVNGAQLPVRLQGFATVLGTITETLVPVNFLKNKCIALAQGKL